jgi:hypothetical protein
MSNDLFVLRCRYDAVLIALHAELNRYLSAWTGHAQSLPPAKAGVPERIGELLTDAALAESEWSLAATPDACELPDDVQAELVR